MHTLFSHHIDSPLGELLVVTNHEGAVCALQFAGDANHVDHVLRTYYHPYTLQTSPAPIQLTHALQHYFDGHYTALDALPVHLPGNTFQNKVWTMLRTIPAGTTATYGALATRLGNVAYARQVGAANAANPIAIIIACHRVIGKDGSLKGFAWGLHRKQWLLQHEQVRLPTASLTLPGF